MPWRAKYITSRHHPLAVANYLLTLLIGVFFLTGVFDSQAISAAVDPAWQDAWEWLLTIGGAAALLGVAWPQTHLEDALRLEAAGAASTTCGLVVYSSAVVLYAGWSSPVWLLFAVLAAGSMSRAWQARSDRQRVEALKAAVDRERPQ